MRSQVRVLLSPPCGPGSHIEDLCNGSTPDSDSVCGGSNPSSSAKKSGYPFGYPDFFIQSWGIRTHLNATVRWTVAIRRPRRMLLTFRPRRNGNRIPHPLPSTGAPGRANWAMDCFGILAKTTLTWKRRCATLNEWLPLYFDALSLGVYLCLRNSGHLLFIRSSMH